MKTERELRSASDWVLDAKRSEELDDVLSDPHGWYTLVYLSRETGPVDVEELSRGVVGLIQDRPPNDVDDEVVRRVQTWLHHGHLPVLDEYDLVTYDSGQGHVALTEQGTAVADTDRTPGRQDATE